MMTDEDGTKTLSDDADLEVLEPSVLDGGGSVRGVVASEEGRHVDPLEPRIGSSPDVEVLSADRNLTVDREFDETYQP